MQRKMRKNRAVILGIMVILLVVFFFRLQVVALLPLDIVLGYAAIVNGEIIFAQEVENNLDALVTQRILLQEAAKTGAVITTEDMQQALAGEEYTIQEIFVLLGNPSSREKIRKQLLIAKYLNQTILPQLSVSEEDAYQYYINHSQEFTLPENAHIAQILVKPEGKTTAQLDDKLQAVLNSLARRVSFAEIAKRYSEDVASANAGGDIGYVYRGEMGMAFDSIAFTLAINETSKTFQTPLGFHIIKVYDKKSPRQLLYGEIKEKLRQQILEQKQKQAFQKHIVQLREKAAIIVFQKQ